MPGMTPAIFGLAGLRLSNDERDFFRDADPVGYILFQRNCQDPEQMRALADDLRSVHGREHLFLSIDQEGGRVARMKPPVWPRYPAGEVFDQLYQIAPLSAIEAVRANAEAMGHELARCGVTVNYHAPLDVRRPETDAVIGDRALGHDPMQVAALGKAMIDGFARAGVAGCLKHMPGHGRATVDSHKDLPVVDASAEELENDIAPFRQLAGTSIGMSAHIVYTAWDGNNPATLSPTIIADIIRGRIGFDGLLLTDDIDMEALSGTVPERAEQAIAAGCDVVLNCWAKLDDMQGIASRLPALPPQGEERLARCFALSSPQATVPERAERAAALLAKRDALLAAAGLA